MSGGIKLTFNYKGEDECVIRSDVILSLIHI